MKIEFRTYLINVAIFACFETFCLVLGFVFHIDIAIIMASARVCVIQHKMIDAIFDLLTMYGVSSNGIKGVLMLMHCLGCEANMVGTIFYWLFLVPCFPIRMH